jgi:hypothetical protein
MPDAKGNVDIRVTLKNARQFIGESKAVAHSIDGVDRAGDKNNRTMKRGGLGAAGMAGSLKMLGGAATIAGAAVGTFAAIELKKAIDVTRTLAGETIALSDATDLSAQDSSRLVAVTKIRGIEQASLLTGLRRLSKGVDGARKGTGEAGDAFKAFGVSQELIKKGKLPEVLGAVSDGFNKLGPSIERNVAAQTLFGRGSEKLRKLLKLGSAGLKEQMLLAGDLGASLSEIDIKNSKDVTKALQGGQLAKLGLQVTLGKKILPLLAKASIAVTKFITAWSKRRGDAGKLRKDFESVWKVVKRIGSAIGTARKGIDRLRGAGREAKAVLSTVFNSAPILGQVRAVLRLIKSLSGVKKAASSAGRWLGNAFTNVKEAFRSAINFIIDGWNGLDLTLSGPAGIGKVTIGTPNIPRFAAGGRVPGARRSADSVPAMLSPGEFVVTGHGEQILNSLTGIPNVLNRVGSVQRAHFGDGGRVSPVPSMAGGGRQIVTKVYLDRRQIAEAVGSEVASRQARR